MLRFHIAWRATELQHSLQMARHVGRRQCWRSHKNVVLEKTRRKKAQEKSAHSQDAEMSYMDWIAVSLSVKPRVVFQSSPAAAMPLDPLIVSCVSSAAKQKPPRGSASGSGGREMSLT